MFLHLILNRHGWYILSTSCDDKFCNKTSNKIKIIKLMTIGNNVWHINSVGFSRYCCTQVTALILHSHTWGNQNCKTKFCGKKFELQVVEGNKECQETLTAGIETLTAGIETLTAGIETLNSRYRISKWSSYYHGKLHLWKLNVWPLYHKDKYIEGCSVTSFTKQSYSKYK